MNGGSLRALSLVLSNCHRALESIDLRELKVQSLADARRTRHGEGHYLVPLGEQRLDLLLVAAKGGARYRA